MSCVWWIIASRVLSLSSLGLNCGDRIRYPYMLGSYLIYTTFPWGHFYYPPCECSTWCRATFMFAGPVPERGISLWPMPVLPQDHPTGWSRGLPDVILASRDPSAHSGGGSAILGCYSSNRAVKMVGPNATALVRWSDASHEGSAQGPPFGVV